MPKKTTSAPDDAVVIERAREGLEEVASPEHVGQASVESLDGVHTVRFESLMPGYPGWFWEVSVSDGDGGALGVLEVHLTPGADALVAPDWVPWADRLEEYRRSEAEREESEAADDEDDLDDVDTLDDDDLDGVDIDQLDLDPAALEIPDDPNDVFDHMDFDPDDEN